MTAKNKLIISIILSTFCISCDIMDTDAIQIINESQKRKFVILTVENDFSFYEKSPLETSIERIIKNDTIWELNLERIEPGEKSVFTDYNWNLTINESKHKKVNVFIFNQSTLTHTNLDSLKKRNQCDSLISLSYDELQRINWNVYIK